MNQTQEFSYNDDIVKKFVIACLFWGFAAFAVGVLIALQLSAWQLNFSSPLLTFSRLRPLHTNAAIFAFAGNAVFAGIYYSTQRLCKTRIFSDGLSSIHFWGWQLIILAALITLPLGITQSKEYAELEWPIDIAIAAIWVTFAVNFFLTLKNRREKHIYVALWFYIGTIVTVALLHIVNSLEVPYSWLHSYPIYAGAQDALVQWWYGHNAVAFVLTTPFLGLMYYFVPKAANRPVYSYRLSIVHFWALVFIYIWAGPHHLLYTALPDWAQTLGVIFSVMVWAPSWGGMINGLLTLRGEWHRLRTEPVLKFLAAGITFYGMATFEGPLLSLKSVNGLAHYTDWIVGHVHSGTLGWNGFLTFGIFYWMIPKLWSTKLYSVRLANAHFWTGFLGIILYIASMWIAGITQGLMLRGIDTSTGRLLYPDFIETVIRIVPMYWVRAVGGGLFLVGYILMLYNVIRTIQSAPKAVAAPVYKVSPQSGFGHSGTGETRHRMLEGMPFVFALLAVIAVSVGTIIEFLPAFLARDYISPNSKVKPYTALELHGRDIYVREGCYVCHSQMIRPMEAEVLRYGTYSRAEESMYDRPFQWGSKRTGPDLARIGGKYPDLWHYRHMKDPREVVNGSIMPSYAWLLDGKIDFKILENKLSVMKMLNVPYSDDEILHAQADAKLQAKQIAEAMTSQGAQADLEDKEIVALIAYLQSLGRAYR